MWILWCGLCAVGSVLRFGLWTESDLCVLFAVGCVLVAGCSELCTVVCVLCAVGCALGCLWAMVVPLFLCGPVGGTAMVHMPKWAACLFP